MGTMFGLFAASTGVGPYISTKSFDLYHSYALAFRLYEAILIVAIAIFAILGPYAFPALSRHAAPASDQKAAA